MCVYPRSVLCNDPDMADIPVNVPLDTAKLRVEKTAVRRIPGEAFYYLSELRYLWVTYNSITSVDTTSFYNLKVLHELRLDGNLISSFPWVSLREMPSLRTLDLHNNRLTSVPTEAIPYLVNITYLDISSNKLATLPSDLLDLWPPFSGVAPSINDTKVVLGKTDDLRIATDVGSLVIHSKCFCLVRYLPWKRLGRIQPENTLKAIEL